MLDYFYNKNVATYFADDNIWAVENGLISKEVWRWAGNYCRQEKTIRLIYFIELLLYCIRTIKLNCESNYIYQKRKK